MCDVAKLMKEYRTTAVRVMASASHQRIAGMFTSTDVMLKVIAAGLEAGRWPGGAIARPRTPSTDLGRKFAYLTILMSERSSGTTITSRRHVTLENETLCAHSKFGHLAVEVNNDESSSGDGPRFDLTGSSSSPTCELSAAPPFTVRLWQASLSVPTRLREGP